MSGRLRVGGSSSSARHTPAGQRMVARPACKHGFSFRGERGARAGQCRLRHPARHLPGPSMIRPLKRLVHVFRVRPRLFIVMLLGVAAGLLLPPSAAAQPVTRWLIAWNVGAWTYGVLAAAMMIRSSRDHMRQRAQLQDDGKYAILGLTVVAAVASLVAIAF